MKPVIKINIQELVEKRDRVVVDLGCGQKKKKGRIGIDQVDLPEVDVVADIEDGLSFFPDSSVDEIHCRSVLEHVENFEVVLHEMMRTLKKDGKAYVFVPHFSNPYYYSDPTHVRFFGLYTFYYYVDYEYQLRRKVPNFYSDIRIRILSQKIVFRSKFGIFGFLKKAFGRIINKSSLLQEYYEEKFPYLIPAHGIEFVLAQPPAEHQGEF